MSPTVKRVIHTLYQRDLIPSLPEGCQIPLPGINKIELYLSFYGNDCCKHCITNSGPHRKEVMKPGHARTILENAARHSVTTRLKNAAGGGKFEFRIPDKCKELDNLPGPPRKMNQELIQQYSNCLMGKGYTSRWVKGESNVELNFGRPSVRLSGGEFYTWPHKIDGREVPWRKRLLYQEQLLNDIREILPEYDIFILTNGRFAESREKTRDVIKHWSGGPTRSGGRTRMSISLDIFHRPPAGSTVEQMLDRIWNACKESGLGAPFLYGINNHWVALVGRALEKFGCCYGSRPDFRNVSRSSFNPESSIKLDPVDLAATGGCRELKGFICETEYGAMLVNNIVIMPAGQLAYCCACVGNFGNFREHPEEALKKITTDPIAMMLRREQSAINLLNIAVEMDPSIQVFGYGSRAAATGSTCYQLLSGKRPER